MFDETYFLIVSNVGFLLIVLMYLVVFPFSEEE